MQRLFPLEISGSRRNVSMMDNDAVDDGLLCYYAKNRILKYLNLCLLSPSCLKYVNKMSEKHIYWPVSFIAR